MNDYFSDRENGPRARTAQVIDPVTWAGFTTLIATRAARGAFGRSFPLTCPDGSEVYGTDEDALGAAIRAEIDGLKWPLETARRDEGDFMSDLKPFAPPTLQVLDLLEFCWRHVASVSDKANHSFFHHTHLSFNQELGRDEFRSDVNRVMARNGLAYEMQANGQFIRLAPPVLSEALRAGALRSGDVVLDAMFEECRVKFLSPDPLLRREALERLFDSFERLKSLANPSNKAESVRMILDRVAAPAPFMRPSLEAEFLALRDIGNGQLFRHHEVSQQALVDVDHIDYMFHRLYALVSLVVKALPH